MIGQCRRLYLDLKHPLFCRALSTLVIVSTVVTVSTLVMSNVVVLVRLKILDNVILIYIVLVASLIVILTANWGTFIIDYIHYIVQEGQP